MIQAYDVYFRYYRGIVELLDNEFNTLDHLTDGHLGDHRTETGPLRMAISRYSASIYGTRDDM